MRVYDNYEEAVRTFQLPGQNKVHFTREPRYGHWTVHFDKGGIPFSLSGQHTSYIDLYNKVNQYLKTREKFRCEIGEEIV